MRSRPSDTNESVATDAEKMRNFSRGLCTRTYKPVQRAHIDTENLRTSLSR